MKNSKIISTFLSFVFAFICAFGLIKTVSVSADVGDSYLLASAISIDDKPDIGVSAPFRQAVVGIINYILTFLGLIAVGFIVYAGILLVMDAGAEENVKKSKNIILYAAVGIVIILLSYSIVNVVFGVKETVT